MVRRGRRRSAASLRDECRNDLARPVSRVTVNQRLLLRGYRARRPIKKPKLAAHHKELRLRFARQHRYLTVHHWRNVVFGDGSRFRLHRVDGRVRVRRLHKEALGTDCVMFNLTAGGGSVYLRRAFQHGSASNLVFLNRNVTRDVVPGHSGSEFDSIR